MQILLLPTDQICFTFQGEINALLTKYIEALKASGDIADNNDVDLDNENDDDEEDVEPEEKRSKTET